MSAAGRLSAKCNEGRRMRIAETLQDQRRRASGSALLNIVRVNLSEKSRVLPKPVIGTDEQGKSL
jgi:hypothetical protein